MLSGNRRGMLSLIPSRGLDPTEVCAPNPVSELHIGICLRAKVYVMPLASKVS
jgi:hypothetical protein